MTKVHGVVILYRV